MAVLRRVGKYELIETSDNYIIRYAGRTVMISSKVTHTRERAIKEFSLFVNLPTLDKWLKGA